MMWIRTYEYFEDIMLHNISNVKEGSERVSTEQKDWFPAVLGTQVMWLRLSHENVLFLLTCWLRCVEDSEQHFSQGPPDPCLVFKNAWQATLWLFHSRCVVLNGYTEQTEFQGCRTAIVWGHLDALDSRYFGPHPQNTLPFFKNHAWRGTASHCMPEEHIPLWPPLTELAACAAVSWRRKKFHFFWLFKPISRYVLQTDWLFPIHALL